MTTPFSPEHAEVPQDVAGRSGAARGKADRAQVPQPQLPAQTTVAVVGAGPAGLALAVTLAQAGIDTVVLDKLAEGANTSRAAVVHARTLEVLEQLNVAQELIARGIKVDRFSVRDGGRRLLALSFGRLPTAYPFALMVPQSETEAVLLERLQALGGQVHRPCEVTDVVQSADGAELTLADGRTLRADWVVGADGMNSTVRQAAGIGFTGGSYQACFVLADVFMDWAPGPDEVSLTFDAQGLTVVAPLPGDRYRVVATVDQAPDTPGLDFISDLLRHRAPGQARLHDLVWSSRFQVHHRVADRFRAGRLLLAGDAAHVHSPAGGQGMNTGIQDAHALGLVLTTSDLNRYEALRRPVALRVVAFTDKLTRIATVRNPSARTLRNLALPVLGRIPAFRTRITTELAELAYR